MDFRLLGSLEVSDGDRVVGIREGRQRSVLTLLLLHHDETVATDRLIDALWGERPPATAGKVLQNHVVELRRAFGHSGAALLRRHGRGYALHLDGGALDIERFDELARAGAAALERDDPAAARDTLEQALALWRGSPLADVTYEEFAQPEITRLEERRLVAVEQRLAAELALGRDADLVAELEGLVAAHPTRERLRGLLMLALYRAGRQADALATYRHCRQALLDELGVDPGPELRALEAAILRQDPELAPAPRARPRAAGRRPRADRAHAAGPVVGPAPRLEIVGRDREVATLASFVEGFPASPACLVLEGAAGVGKTTLWRAAVDAARARGFTVLEARPVQAEATYAFAGIGDLLGPVLDRVVDELVAPQADALRVALMLERPRGAPADGRAIAVAALSALRVLATGGPVLLAVDDVQWLDGPSAAVLAFAWRRLENAPVGLAAGWRAGERVPDFIAPDERTQHLTLEPLSLGAVRQILQSRLELVLPRPVLLRLYEVAGGNAFYALELGRALGRRDVLPAPGEPLPVPEQLRELMRERLTALPPAARKLLAATAALVQPTAELAVGELGGESALRAALRANVLELHGDRLHFTHPLLAAAAYEEVDPIARRALHRRLAKLVGDEEERARHLALGAAGPDPEVAAALERAAEHARTRGSSTAAAELCELARRLTPVEAVDDRHRRAIAAARYRWLSGDTPGATAVLEGVIAAARAGRLRAEARLTLASVLQIEGDQPRAAELARQALAEPDLDDPLRAEAASRLAVILMFMREDLQTGLEHARLAADIAERSGDPATLACKLSHVSLLQAMTGSPEAFETARAAARLGEAQDWRGVFGSPSYDRANLAMWTDGHDEAAQLLRTLYEDVLQRGDEGGIPHTLAQRALADYLAGRWLDAARHADAGYEAAVAAGQRLSQAWTRSTRALVRASLGLEDDARADAREATALAGERGMGVALIQSGWALGVLELSLDRPAEAARVLTPLRERFIAAGVGEPGSIRFVPDEVEALIALGEVDAAIVVLDWLEHRARALDRASALAAALRCRGLLAARNGEHHAALEAFERALVEHERVAMPFERARTLLALGASHRRAKQRALARATLGDALAIFDQLGAALWAAKARAELARIGGRTPAGDELTVTERRTAELVAEGLSNKQIAAALFVTLKTVETQLSRIYLRLDIHSRTQLAARLRSGDRPPTKP